MLGPACLVSGRQVLDTVGQREHDSIAQWGNLWPYQDLIILETLLVKAFKELSLRVWIFQSAPFCNRKNLKKVIFWAAPINHLEILPIFYNCSKQLKWLSLDLEPYTKCIWVKKIPDYLWHFIFSRLHTVHWPHYSVQGSMGVPGHCTQIEPGFVML